MWTILGNTISLVHFRRFRASTLKFEQDAMAISLVQSNTRDKSSWHYYFVKKSVDESAWRDGFPDNFECSLFRFRRKYVQRRRWNFLEIILHPFEFWRLVWYIKAKYLFNLYFESLVCFLFFYQRISLPFFCFCILTSFLVAIVPFYSCINFPRFFNSFLTKQFKHGSLCGLLHAQLKLFCSCFKNHDDTDFWGKLSGDVEVWILHVRSQETRGSEMPKHLWLGRALRKATKWKTSKDLLLAFNLTQIYSMEDVFKNFAMHFFVKEYAAQLLLPVKTAFKRSTVWFPLHKTLCIFSWDLPIRIHKILGSCG